MDRSANSRSRSPFSSPGHNNRLREHHSRFNCQTVIAYLISIIASFLIVIGVYKYWHNGHEQRWLLLPPLGLVLIFLGSCIYRCGVNRLYHYNYGHYLGGHSRAGVSTHQARASVGIFESSQLSLNMLPQCFTNYDTVSGGVVHTREQHSTTAATSTASAAAQRYLSLPLDSLLSPPSHTTQSQAEVHQRDEQQLLATAGVALVAFPLVETSVDNEADLINVGKRYFTLLVNSISNI